MEREKKLLIIDDEMDICLLMTLLCRSKFDVIECAHSLEDALKKAQLNWPDVILLDNNLPDGNGIEYISAFRNIPNKYLMEVIMISALDIRTEALAAGADYFICKPISGKDLPW